MLVQRVGALWGAVLGCVSQFPLPLWIKAQVKPGSPLPFPHKLSDASLKQTWPRCCGHKERPDRAVMRQQSTSGPAGASAEPLTHRTASYEGLYDSVLLWDITLVTGMALGPCSAWSCKRDWRFSERDRCQLSLKNGK